MIRFSSPNAQDRSMVEGLNALAAAVQELQEKMGPRIVLGKGLTSPHGDHTEMILEGSGKGKGGGSTLWPLTLYRVGDTLRVAPGLIGGNIPRIGGVALDAATPPSFAFPGSNTYYYVQINYSVTAANDGAGNCVAWSAGSITTSTYTITSGGSIPSDTVPTLTGEPGEKSGTAYLPIGSVLSGNVTPYHKGGVTVALAPPYLLLGSYGYTAP